MGLSRIILKQISNELVNDPLGRSYSGMDAQQKTDDINTAYVNENIETVSGFDIFEAFDPSEYNGTSSAEKDLLHAIVGMGTVYVKSGNTITALLAIFGAGTTTRDNLVLLQIKKITRAQDLGWPALKKGWVELAIQLYGD